MRLLPGCLLGALFLLSACTNPKSPAPAPVQTPGDSDPALWLLSDDDTDIYLFGTVHFLPPGLSWFDEAVRGAFDASGTLALEMIAPPEAELAQLAFEYGMAQDGIALRDRLSADSRVQYEALMQKLGLPRAQLDAYKPWFAFMTLYQMMLHQGGFDSRQGAEEILTSAATQEGKDLVQIESAREQLQIFDRLSPEEQLALLQSLLDAPDAIGDQTARIIAYWSAGDIAGLNEFLAANSTGGETEHALIAERNENWVEWIEDRLNTPGTIFVAVGAAHLAGPDNVRDLLSRRGLDARRVEY